MTADSEAREVGESVQAKELLRHIPEAAWDVATWATDRNYHFGTVDVADRLRLATLILDAERDLSPKAEPIESSRSGLPCPATDPASAIGPS